MVVDSKHKMSDIVGYVVSAFTDILRNPVKFLHSLKGFASRQFIAGLCFCLCCAFINCLSQVYVDRMHWAHFKEGDSKPLPDLGFIILPKLHTVRLPDIWNVLIVVGTIAPVVLFHPHKVKVMRRYAAVQGTCFLLRSITIMATILPNPYEECVNSSRADEIPLIEAFRVMAGFRFTCGDVLYSGHAANFTLMALIWQEYGRTYTDSPPDHSHRSVGGKRGSLPTVTMDISLMGAVDDDDPLSKDTFSKQWYVAKFFPGLFWTIAAVGYLIIIACRFHYTVDVVVGIVVVAKQWGLYHMIIRTPKLLSQVPFLQWYESKGIYHPDNANMTDQIYDISVEDDGENESEFGFEETPRNIASRQDFSSIVAAGVVDPVELAEVGGRFGGSSEQSPLNRPRSRQNSPTGGLAVLKE